MLNRFDELTAEDRIIVALDCPEDEALHIASVLSGKARWMKVGMTLFYKSGPDIIRSLKEQGYRVFLDLKLHDIPHQVEGAAASAARQEIDMLTLHTVGGIDMMKAAQRGVEIAAKERNLPSPATLGITVLTSMDQKALEQTGVNRAVEEQVRILAQDACESGLSGVVASPQEAAMLREMLGPDAFIVTPGVRPKGTDLGDQSRVSTPREALLKGASHIVVGRPITQSDDLVGAFEGIVAEIYNDYS